MKQDYEQIVSNSKCDLAAQATTELVLDARPGGRLVP